MSRISLTQQIEKQVLRQSKQFILGQCQCGCNESVPIRNSRGELGRFKHGHNRLDYFKNTIFMGENHHAWKGGRYKDKNTGYVYVYASDHPFKNKDNKVAEHRKVYEDYYNCILLPFTQIHHVNGIRDDNRIENIIPTYNGIHRSTYHKLDTSDRFCLLCGSNTTYFRKDKNCYDWHTYENGHICRNCYRKLTYRATH